MSLQAIKKAIKDGQTALGIEFGSTRIKAVLIGPDHAPIASGGYSWENRLENGIWTYHLEDVWAGLADCYRELANDVRTKYATELVQIGSIGISGMMHGYLVFDKTGNLLVPFRTWRNTMTAGAAEELTRRFGFNIPQRWSVAHLYQAILNKEEHVRDIACLTTLASYVHEMLTGERVVGIGEASGMFPIDSNTNQFDKARLAQFDTLLAENGLSYHFADITPKVLVAGENAGKLTLQGAKLLDSTGALQPGAVMCPPEGDAGTGMVATNSVAERTGNVSAGTSIFAMAVLESALSKVYPEIDMITTPSGRPVAMVHCNNCSSDIDAWVKLFGEVLQVMGANADKPALYDALYNAALTGDADCGGLLSYNYFSGEHITGMEEGRPLFVRLADAKLTLGNFMRTHLYSALATLKLGMDILFEQEHVKLDKLLGHGGFFKTKGVGQRILAGAVGVPVAVMETAGEGGAWGIALLAAYSKNKTTAETLEDYLQAKAFANSKGASVDPNVADSQGFAAYMARYKQGLAIERAAVDALK